MPKKAIKKPLPFPAERKRVGAVLRKHRKATGLTQEALGFEIDMDRTYISDIETGKRNPSLVNLLKLCKALGVSAAKLFSEAEL